MPTTCCVVNCGSRGDRDIVKFYKIPGELHFAHRTDLNELSKQRRQKWIEAIKREDLTDVKLRYSRVCNKHFMSGKPSELNDKDNFDWVPSLAMGYGNDEVVHKNNPRKTHISTARTERARKRRKCLVEDEPVMVPIVPDETEDAEILEAETSDNENDKQCQTDITGEDFTQIMSSLESRKKIEAKLKEVEMSYHFMKIALHNIHNMVQDQ